MPVRFTPDPEQSTIRFTPDPEQPDNVSNFFYPRQTEKEHPFVQQAVGALAKGGMKVGEAITAIPENTVRLAKTLDEMGKTPEGQVGMYHMGQVESAYKQLGKDVEAQGRIESGLTAELKGITDMHRRGQQAILAAHPEWASEPPKNFVDLVTSPRKLALSLLESAPLLVASGILTAAGQPALSVSMMTVTEGQNIKNEVLADGRTELDAQAAYLLYAPIAGAIERMQLEGIIKVAKGTYKPLLGLVAKKVAVKGLEAVKYPIIKTAVGEALEEMAQGTWQETTEKLVYDKSIPGGLGGFIDRRLQEGFIGFTMGLIPGLGGKAVRGMTETTPIAVAEEQGPTGEITLAEPTTTPQGEIVPAGKAVEKKQIVIENQDDVSDTVHKILREEFPIPSRSAKSEAAYFDNGQIRIRVAEHPVVYSESDVDIVIGIGENAGPDSDFVFKGGRESEASLREQIIPAIEKATLRHEIQYAIDNDEVFGKKTALLAQKYPEVLAEYPNLAKQAPAPGGEISAEKAPAGAEGPAPAIAKTKLSKEQLLAEGHKIQREYKVSDKDYRNLAKKTTGKRSMGKMSVKKMVAFVDALRGKYGPVSGLTEEDFGRRINFEGKQTPLVPIIVELAKETETLPTKKLPERVVSGGLGRGVKRFGVGIWRVFAGMRGSRPGRITNIFGGLKENSMWLRVFRNGLIEGPANMRSALNMAYLQARWRFQEENGIDSKLLAKVSRTQQYWPGPVEAVQEIAGYGPDKIDITLNGQIYSETRAGLANWYFQLRQPEGRKHAVLHGLVFDDVHTGPISEEQLQTEIIDKAEADPWIVSETNWVDNILPYYFRDPINNTSQRRVGKSIATKKQWFPLDVFKTPRVGKLGFELKQPKKTYNLIVDQSILQPRKGPGGPLIRGDYFDTMEAVKEGVFEYVAYSEAYDLAHTVLAHQGITETLYAKGYGFILKYLNEILDNETASQNPRGPIDNALSYLTRGGVRGLIHYNPKTAAIQVSSSGMILKDTSAKYFAAGVEYATTHKLSDSFKIVPWMFDRWYNDRGPLMIGGSAERFGLTLQQQGKLALNMKGAWGLKVTDQFPFHAAVGVAIAEYEDYVAGKLDPESMEGKYWTGKPIVKTESLQWNGLIVDRFTVLRRGQQSYDKFDRSANTSAKDLVSRTAFLFQSFHEGAKNVIQTAFDTLSYNGWSAKNIKIAARQIGPVLSSYAVEQMIRKSVGVAMYLGVGAVLRKKYKMDRWYMWPLEALTSAFDMIPIFGRRITGALENFVRLLMKDKPKYAGRVGEPLPLQMVDTMVQGSDNMALALAYYLSGNTDKGEKALIRGLGGIYEGVGLSQGMPVYQVKQFQTQLEEEETARPGISRRRRGQRSYR